ncbi:TlpA disulfide reductase family protein [Mucilaginibacter sabulilitoris]|uniref:TlpA disulfide reductase family protein n=1 Tax=Mucilaginibacter sabulilitoris TaxID=1173583 RepID=A0ABZ0TRP5_9SPHI|nr:TlpA disulfide reductase family protein [Mucilaginibacter sabulilitoris]WPU94823.1 TlpA disulfide reductase family protein [Mucilaginibacter sabulilitoris]
MKKLTIVLVLALLCLKFYTQAQEKAHLIDLKPGDKMPDVKITNIINSKVSFAKISDYKGKLIILDFWSTWCAACIDGFSHLDSLQRLFPDKIHVLLVNPKKEGDNEKGVKVVINRMNEWSSHPFKLPIVLQDTAISNNFQIHGLPHCAWIGPNGYVIGITGKEEVTLENIKKGIAGEMIEITEGKH